MALPRGNGGPHRPLWGIAAEISDDWHMPNYAAKPYLDAMHDLDQIGDMYMSDPAESIVKYFLANSNTWRGETARKIKLELKELLRRVK